MLKPREIDIDGSYLVAKGVLRARRIGLDTLHGIRVQRVLSLSDELGVTLLGEHDIFFTDAEPWFSKITDALDFDSKLGPCWYRRAEEGETIEYRGPLSVHEA